MLGERFNLVRNKTAFCFLFPIVFCSHFVVSHYWLPSVLLLKHISFRFLLINKRGRQVLPEVIFWFVFVLSRRLGLVSLFNKKAYSAGLAVYSKMYSAVNVVSSKCFKNILLFKNFFLYFCKKGRALSTYWFRFFQKDGAIHHFVFRDISFDERFNRLMHFAPFAWLDFAVIIRLSTVVLSILPVVFFLRDFLKIPMENIRLKERHRVSKASNLVIKSKRFRKKK